VTVVALAALSAGCANNQIKKTEVPQPQEEAAAQPAKQPVDTQPLLGADWKEIPQLEDAYFDVDKADLREDARAALKRNASWLKETSAAEVRVGGYCDDRGTVEYNLSLGQRRAEAVRKYYKALGIASSRLSSISFGEEHPVCTEETEECWAKNRRAATQVRVHMVESENNLQPQDRQ
jgi:peptidoglycan-associated lipoprotein